MHCCAFAPAGAIPGLSAMRLRAWRHRHTDADARDIDAPAASASCTGLGASGGESGANAAASNEEGFERATPRCGTRRTVSRDPSRSDSFQRPAGRLRSRPGVGGRLRAQAPQRDAVAFAEEQRHKRCGIFGATVPSAFKAEHAFHQHLQVPRDRPQLPRRVDDRPAQRAIVHTACDTCS